MSELDPQITRPRPGFINRRLMPSVLSTALVLAACSGHDRESADTAILSYDTTATTVPVDTLPIETTVPETSTTSVTTSTTIPAPVDTCATNNPSLPAYVAENEAVNDSLGVLFDQYFDEPNQTEAESLMAVQALTDAYGFTLTLPHEPIVSAGYDFGAVEGELVDVLLNNRLREMVEALSHFTPEIIRALELKEFNFVQGITRVEGHDDDGSIVDVAAGLYDPNINATYIDIGGFGNIRDVTVHELTHAIDAKLLCGPNDMFVDETLAAYNSEPYVGYGEELYGVDPKYTAMGPEREYVWFYGAANPAEDRATIIEWTFTQRGLILEGDPDWDSPLRHKQAELVRRLEEVTPGLTDNLSRNTLFLRNHTYRHELSEAVANPFVPGEQGTVAAFVERAVAEGLPLTQLRSTVLEIRRPGHEDKYSIIHNPIIFRDETGEVSGVAWANKYSGVNGGFFDRHRMKFRSRDVSEVQNVEGQVTFTPRDDQHTGGRFSPAEIFVDGVLAEEIYANGDSFTADQKNTLWPTEIDPSE